MCFSICESFFIFAQTDRALGWDTDKRFYLLNPWSQQRQPWIEQATRERAAISVYLMQQFRAMEAPERPRLGLWLPLRQRRTGAESSYIRNLFPGDEGGFLPSLKQALEALAPDLVLLRKLETISLWSEQKPIASLSFGADAQRMPDPESKGGRVRGAIISSHAEGERNLAYTIHAMHAEESFRDLSESQDWPKVISYDANGQARYDNEDKGIPAGGLGARS